MLPQWNTSPEDLNLIAQIASRALHEVKRNPTEATKLILLMDLEACHANCPLDLAGLLLASRLNFAHDIVGIDNNIDRRTGRLENCFLPRYALPSHVPQEKP